MTDTLSLSTGEINSLETTMNLVLFVLSFWIASCSISNPYNSHASLEAIAAFVGSFASLTYCAAIAVSLYGIGFI